MNFQLYQVKIELFGPYQPSSTRGQSLRDLSICMLYVRVGILLTCEKHLHDRIISLRGEVWHFYGSACTKSGKWAVLYFFAMGIDFYLLLRS